jgi:valyl-tRNA synthetase
LVEVLEQVLLLLHPIMPFVTEEIWQKLPHDDKPLGRSAGGLVTIMTEDYPRAHPAWHDSAGEDKMAFLIAAIRAIRNLRREANCPPGKAVKVVFRAAADRLSLLRAQQAHVRVLARVGSAEYLEGGEPPKGAATAIVGATEIYLPLGDLINVQEERTRLNKELGKVADELARIQKKLANEDFLRKAKEEVIHGERQKAGQYEEKVQTLRRSLERLAEIERERT